MGNDFNMMLKIDVWDEDKSSRNDLIGSVQVSLGMLQKLAQSKAALPLVKEAEGIHRRKEGRGNLLVTQCLIEDTPVLPRKASVPGNYPGEVDFMIMVLILMDFDVPGDYPGELVVHNCIIFLC